MDVLNAGYAQSDQEKANKNRRLGEACWLISTTHPTRHEITNIERTKNELNPNMNSRDKNKQDTV
jgi:hemolysin-activating ACP:hemolysin acyltransferase